MIVDLLGNAAQYAAIHKKFAAAFHYLKTTDLANTADGKYMIDGDALFAIVQESNTLDPAAEQMESHRKYIDIHYMVRGEELVGHALPGKQTVSKAYDAEEDFMLYADAPSFFTKLAAGTFMIFFPTDLHMPGLKNGDTQPVKKVVMKIAV